MIKNLVFDFGNVLLLSNFERYLDSIVSDESIKTEFRKVVFSKEFTQKLDMGYQSSSELFEELMRHHPSLAPYIHIFRERWMEHLFGEMPGMYQLLERYKAKGYKLYGLSNWSDMIYTVMERFPIFQLLNGRIISCEEHLIKPDTAIYHRLYEKYHLLPSECLFADDKEENIIAAQHTNMKGITFHDALQYESELKRYLSNKTL